MIGGLFAGLAESPGQMILYRGRSFKAYRGMGSLGAMADGSEDRYSQKGTPPGKLVPEGVEGRVPYKGPLAPFVQQLVGGLRAGMGYCGTRTIEEFRHAGPPPVLRPVAGQTYYYEKDPSVRPALLQAPEQGKVAAPQPESATLPRSATNTTPPLIGEIGLRSEADLRREIDAEVVQGNQSDIFRRFPTGYEPLTKDPYQPRAFAPAVEQVEPFYVCYGRLYFENKNTDRYGWELGILQPMVSTLVFYKDYLMFPYNYGTRVCQRWEADAGYCLPGDPVPYLIYPVELSLTGLTLEAGTAVGLAAIFNGGL